MDSYFNNEELKEAIYLASPVLYEELHKSFTIDKNNRQQLLYTLMRYFHRMSTRCTPFGLFAGCGIGKLGEQTTILLNNKMDRTTRLDMLYLCTLYDFMLQIPEVKEYINYYPNTTIHPIGKKLRYIEWKHIQTNRKYEINEVDQSVYLNKVLKKAVGGAKIDILVNSLTNNRISIEVAKKFIDDLIESQILVGDLNQAVTGDDYFTQLIALIETIDRNMHVLAPLKRIKFLLDKLDNCFSGIDIYKEIISSLKEVGVPYEEKYLFQVDMTNNATKASLGKEIINELQSAMTFLNRITLPNEKNTLSEFKKAFYNRYENRKIPLMEALDPELGIGYPIKGNQYDPSPLIDDIRLFLPKGDEMFLKYPFQAILHQKAIECITKNKGEIVFTDEDVKNFSLNWNDLPPTMYSIIQIIKAKNEDTLIKLNTFSGSSGANLLARFAHTNLAIHNFAKEIVDKEQTLVPDAILAEIVHLPESRIGNVVCRPHIRDYEILYLSTSDLPREQLIEVSDLLIYMQNGELIIFSKRLKKRIIPRLTTAHNYNNGLPVYHFLCDMQMHTGRGGLFFNWGHFTYPFRPRVRYNNTILSLATWFVKKEQMNHLFKIKEDENLLFEIDNWRKKYNIPQYTLMPDGDNNLFTDWDNTISIRTLFSIIKSRPSVEFTEFLFDPEHAVVSDDKGNVYLNECIVAFYKDTVK